MSLTCHKLMLDVKTILLTNTLVQYIMYIHMLIKHSLRITNQVKDIGRVQIILRNFLENVQNFILPLKIVWVTDFYVYYEKALLS